MQRSCADEAFERALEAFCADGETDRLRLLATYRADGLRRMLTGVYETLRSAGRPLVLELGERPSSRRRSPPSAGSADASSTTRRRPRTSAASATEALRMRHRLRRRQRVVDLSAFQARVPRGVVRAGAQGGRASRARGARVARPRSAPGAARRLRGRVRGSEAPGVGRRLRGPPARRARPAPRRRRAFGTASGFASGSSWSTSSRTRTASSARSSTWSPIRS